MPTVEEVTPGLKREILKTPSVNRPNERWTERPHRRLISWKVETNGSTRIFDLPMPYMRYILRQVAFHPENKTSYWAIHSVYMQPYQTIPATIACLPNLGVTGRPCMRRNKDRSQTRLLARFWEGRFNSDLYEFRDHKVWIALAKEADVDPNYYSIPVFEYWESLSVGQFQHFYKKHIASR